MSRIAAYIARRKMYSPLDWEAFKQDKELWPLGAVTALGAILPIALFLHAIDNYEFQFTRYGRWNYESTDLRNPQSRRVHFLQHYQYPPFPLMADIMDNLAKEERKAKLICDCTCPESEPVPDPPKRSRGKPHARV